MFLFLLQFLTYFCSIFRQNIVSIGRRLLLIDAIFLNPNCPAQWEGSAYSQVYAVCTYIKGGQKMLVKLTTRLNNLCIIYYIQIIYIACSTSSTIAWKETTPTCIGLPSTSFAILVRFEFNPGKNILLYTKLFHYHFRIILKLILYWWSILILILM